LDGQGPGEGSGGKTPSDERAREEYRLGDYKPAVRARLALWTSEEAARRVFSRDFTFWSRRPVAELTDRLGWLDLPRTMAPEAEGLEALSARVRGEGFRHVVLLGMGGSSLAPQVYQAVFGNLPGYPSLSALESTHPDAVRCVAGKIDPAKTLFIVASKSGTTIETLSFFKYFFSLVSTSQERPGSCFVAITDPKTPLADLARERGFLQVFQGAPDVGGRYSALSHFGLVPAALIGVDVGALLGRARNIASLCALPEPAETNPGLMLGAALGELGLAGRDKITLFTSPALEAFPGWLEQLVAESTGKAGRGLLPVVGEPAGMPGAYGDDRVFVRIGLENEPEPLASGLAEELSSRGHPVIGFKLGDRTDLAAEIFRWEAGTASAGAVLGINPFDQPDVKEAKTFARQAMSEKSPLRAGVQTISAGAGEDLKSRIGRLLATSRPGDYLSIQAFIAPSEEARRGIQAIRAALGRRAGLAITAGFGPGFLHSTGQLHKGGPSTGIFIQLVDRPPEDLAVPGEEFTFGRLIAAQALGDYKALAARKRRLLRIDLGPRAEEGLALLLSAIDSLG
jgi:transaldolase/glucose-6-phosphate isomerase